MQLVCAIAMQPAVPGTNSVFKRLTPAVSRRPIFCGAEKERSVANRLRGGRVFRLLKRTAQGWVAAEKTVKGAGIHQQVVSKQKELQEIAAFADWFRCVAFLAASADLLPFLSELWGGVNGSDPGESTTLAVAGGLIGIYFAILNAVAHQRLWKKPHKTLNVVITGSTRGIGKAVAREFLRTGDRVYITSRSAKGVYEAVKDFRNELRTWGKDPNMVMGTFCNISSPSNAQRLAFSARDQMGHVDLWINCAGYSGSFREFTDTPVKTMTEVVNTNLLGSLLCTRNAIRLMKDQPQGGHIFNTEGAGSDFSPTPNYAVYGATKAAIAQFSESLKSEVSGTQPTIGIHTIQPGMVLTKLLLEGATVSNKQFFNILCEQPEIVAAFLVPRMRTVVAKGSRSTKIRYLTVGRALERLMTAPFRLGRFFDHQGRMLYPNEVDRLHGPYSKATNRQAEQARDRTRGLATLYSVCMTSTFCLIALLKTSV